MLFRLHCVANVRAYRWEALVGLLLAETRSVANYMFPVLLFVHLFSVRTWSCSHEWLLFVAFLINGAREARKFHSQGLKVPDSTIPV